jgi:arsenical resistance protein ArsH
MPRETVSDPLAEPSTPAIIDDCFRPIDAERLLRPETSDHAPRILILYGSLRARSFSRLAAEEAGRILTRLGAEVRFFNPSGLPLVDQPGADMGKVEELWDLVQWSEGMVWSRPPGLPAAIHRQVRRPEQHPRPPGGLLQSHGPSVG